MKLVCGRAVWLVPVLGWAVAAISQQGAPRRPANAPLQRILEAMAAEPAVARAHWGVAVERLDGTVVAGLNAGQFFQPASNAKLFTTAAAMALLPMEERLSTKVIASGYFEAGGVYRGDLRLRGVGDANFSGRPVPYRVTPQGQAEAPHDELRYVRELADGVKASGITRVEGDVVGDDTLFPWDPYPQDWAVDDLPWYYGAPVSGLMVADNAVTLTVKAAANGQAATAALDPALPFYSLDVDVTAGTATALQIERPAGSKVVKVRGTMAADAKPYVQGLSIENPAEYAAMALKAALEADGIVVTGKALAKLNPLVQPDFEKSAAVPLESFAPKATRGLLMRGSEAAVCMDCGETWHSRVVAEHVGPPLYDDVAVTNKTSQNQHAELFLRQLGFFVAGGATTASGARVVRAFLTEQAGVDGGDFVFVDGSGLSGHDLVTPRATTALLRYAAGQPWGEKWKASLPVGGVDGSLRSRFTGELKGRVFAKTGTLGEARALSGYLVANSGKTLAFSVMVTGHTPKDKSDELVMDRMVGAIAAAE